VCHLSEEEGERKNAGRLRVQPRQGNLVSTSSVSFGDSISSARAGFGPPEIEHRAVCAHSIHEHTAQDKGSPRPVSTARLRCFSRAPLSSRSRRSLRDALLARAPLATAGLGKPAHSRHCRAHRPSQRGHERRRLQLSGEGCSYVVKNNRRAPNFLCSTTGPGAVVWGS
jgi:hypothetical protein